MNILIRFGIGVAALALSVGIGAGAYATYGSDDAPPTQAAGAPEIVGDDAAGGGGLAMTCIVGTVDCNDTPDIKYDDFGETDARCMAEYRDCAEPAPCPPEDCTVSQNEVCKSGIAPDGTFFETCVGCGYSEPAPGQLVDPVSPIEPAVDLPLGAPEIDPAVGGPATDFQMAPDVAAPPPSGPASDFQIAPDFDPEMAGTGCLGIDPCTLSSYSLCMPGDCSISSDGILVCGYIAPCRVEELLPGETEVKPVPADVPCAVGPCFGNDPLAGVPANCPSDPCTIYSPDQPGGVPCDTTEPCAIQDPAVREREPENTAPACPPVPSSGGGTSSSSGSAGEPPATDAATPAAE